MGAALFRAGKVLRGGVDCGSPPPGQKEFATIGVLRHAWGGAFTGAGNTKEKGYFHEAEVQRHCF